MNPSQVGSIPNVPVLTVPSTATSPYFLRQTFTNTPPSQDFPSVPFTKCDLYANGVLALQLMTGAVTDLNVPFKAGEVITASCGSYGGYWTFVFSY